MLTLDQIDAAALAAKEYRHALELQRQLALVPTDTGTITLNRGSAYQFDATLEDGEMATVVAAISAVIEGRTAVHTTELTALSVTVEATVADVKPMPVAPSPPSNLAG